MKFSISRDALLKPLQLVSGVVERRQTLPILSNVLLDASEQGLAVTATDLEVEIQANTTVDGVAPGQISVPARKMIDICRTLPDGAAIQFTVDQDKAVLRSAKTRFTLTTLPAADFPNVEAEGNPLEFELPQKTLKELIDKTHFAMAQQDVRYYLNGLLLELRGGEIRSVATDGHRLAMCRADGEIPVEDAIQAIVPRKGVLELARLLDDSDAPARVSLGENHLRVAVDDITFTSKLIDGKFPDYERVLPQGGDKEVLADKETLRQSLVRASILSNEKYRGIRLEFENGLMRATAHNPEQEEAEDEIEVSYEGDTLEIGFNVTYLLDAITAIKTEGVRLTLSDSNSSGLIHPEGNDDCQYVVMPMRL